MDGTTEKTARAGAPEIAATLRREITAGRLRQHDRLPAERTLAAAHGVARNTLREALARLAEEGWVEIRPGSGTYVAHKPDLSGDPIAEARPLELMDARFALEPHICRLCVAHGQSQDFDRLDALCDEMEARPGDADHFAELDAAFHDALAETTNNRLLVWMIGQMGSVRSLDEWMRMRRATLGEDIIALYNAQHRRIVERLRARDAEGAAEAMKEHLATARQSLQRALQT